MPRLLPLFLLCLTLLTAACKKDTAEEPAPSLEGRWTPQTYDSKNYAANGGYIGGSSGTEPADYFLLKDGILTWYHPNAVAYPTISYTKDNDMVRFIGKPDWHILEVTSNKLVYEVDSRLDPELNSSQGYYVSTKVCTR
ncbi:hypothetical protein E5K00_03015 [Hymenobacter aquaticus]|uniref:Lipocalin-like domain-containing protein n=1 Tax=Hymenobacter aquaticus TaxID=1867101 RepID=A0A4Z0Q2G0_9BACT|nr:hypothetical protein [Hymenobacter aquaticus]TGE24200.1 hypothetical protein E5K00_03015 [Hymenobacter aquaticus]